MKTSLYTALIRLHPKGAVDETRGAIAQLGERLNGIQEVVGSIPIGSTSFRLLLKIFSL